MDIRWYTYTKICRRNFAECSFKDELVAKCGGNEDIAWALFFHLRSDSLTWLQRNVPALDDQMPAKLIADGQADRVRDCLWSMPC
jgi:hypothetical protein